MQDYQEPLLRASNLKVWFPVKRGLFKKTVGYVKAVDGVSLEVRRGETLGIVGESGCGKTTLGKSIMRLQNLTDGRIFYRFDGNETDITRLNARDTLKFRQKVQMVFQDPLSSFNPMKTIKNALEQPLKVHGVQDAAKRDEIIRNMMLRVNIQPDAVYRYPHELSGGQRQRVSIGRALEIDPEVLVLDEAVSALDVSVQAQVLNLLKRLQRENGLTYLFIAHDLSVVQYMSDKIAVMYLGKIVEMAPSDELYQNPLHPYTRALLSAVPLPTLKKKKERIVLSGDVPSPINKPSGCPFHPRCPECREECARLEPPFISAGSAMHMVACFRTGAHRKPAQSE